MTVNLTTLLGYTSGGGITTVSGTANQITATTVSSTVTLSLPSTLIIPGTIAEGTLGYSDTNVLGSFQNSVNSYNQLILQNTNSGSTASSDFVVSNNLGTASTYYGDFGINSSGFTGSGSFNSPNAVYLSATSGDLVLGTTTSNAIHFVINGGTTDAFGIGTSGQFLVAGSAGTSGYVLTSGGASAAPTWTAASGGGSPSTLDAVDWVIQPCAAAFMFNGTTLDFSSTNPIVGSFISGGYATPTTGQTVYLNTGVASQEGIYTLGSVSTLSAVPITRVSGWSSGRTLYEGQTIYGRYGDQWDGQYVPPWSTTAYLPGFDSSSTNTSTGEIQIYQLNSTITGGSVYSIPYGWPVKFTVASGATLPAPLVSGTTYYSLGPGTNGYTTLSATSGGSQITLTTVGTNGSYNGQSIIATVTYGRPLVFHGYRFILTLTSLDVGSFGLSPAASWVLGTTVSGIYCRAEVASSAFEGVGTTSMGNGAVNSGTGISIGAFTQGNGGVVIGYQASNQNGGEAVAIGRGSLGSWYGVALGYNASNNSSATNAVALGYNSSNLWSNSVAYTNDGLTLSGGSPFRHTVFLNGPSTSGTGTTILVTDNNLYSGFTPSSLIVPSYTRLVFSGTVTATDQTSGNSACWYIEGIASCGATASTIVVSEVSIRRISYTPSVATAIISISATTYSGTINIQCTGSAGLTLIWGGCLNIDISSTTVAPITQVVDQSQLTFVNAVASEALTAGAWVTLYNNSGTIEVQNSNATSAGTRTPVHGYVSQDVASSATAQVFITGTNTNVSGMTLGSAVYLSTTNGIGTNTAPSGANNIVQQLGVATSSTSVLFEPSVAFVAGSGITFTPSNGTISIASSGGASVYNGTATVNFGTANNTATIAVTGQSSFVNTMQVEAWLAPVANSTNLEDDYIVTPFSVTVPYSTMVNGTGFTIVVKCHQGMAHGKFNLNWRYQ